MGPLKYQLAGPIVCEMALRTIEISLAEVETSATNRPRYPATVEFRFRVDLLMLWVRCEKVLHSSQRGALRLV